MHGQVVGYSNGLIIKDDTFKTSKEKLVTAVWGTVDIKQRGHHTAFGIASHEDTEANEDGALIIRDFTNNLLIQTRDYELPDVWSAQLKASVYTEYSELLTVYPRVQLTPGGCASPWL